MKLKSTLMAAALMAGLSGSQQAATRPAAVAKQAVPLAAAAAAPALSQHVGVPAAQAALPSTVRPTSDGRRAAPDADADGEPDLKGMLIAGLACALFIAARRASATERP